MPRTPEQQAREKIDAQLEDCGWIVQDSRKADFSAGRGIALREVRLKSGACDYLLLADRKAIGVVEAKRKEPPSPSWPSIHELRRTPT